MVEPMHSSSNSSRIAKLCKGPDVKWILCQVCSPAVCSPAVCSTPAAPTRVNYCFKEDSSIGWDRKHANFGAWNPDHQHSWEMSSSQGAGRCVARHLPGGQGQGSSGQLQGWSLLGDFIQKDPSGGFQSMGGTPSDPLIIFGYFSRNKPSSSWGFPIYGNPILSPSINEGSSMAMETPRSVASGSGLSMRTSASTTSPSHKIQEFSHQDDCWAMLGLWVIITYN